MKKIMMMWVVVAGLFGNVAMAEAEPLKPIVFCPILKEVAPGEFRKPTAEEDAACRRKVVKQWLFCEKDKGCNASVTPISTNPNTHVFRVVPMDEVKAKYLVKGAIVPRSIAEQENDVPAWVLLHPERSGEPVFASVEGSAARELAKERFADRPWIVPVGDVIALINAGNDVGQRVYNIDKGQWEGIPTASKDTCTSINGDRCLKGDGRRVIINN